jgi:hypothetical protein
MLIKCWVRSHQDRMYERRMRREIEEDTEMFGDKDAFVTSAYKERLQEVRHYPRHSARRQLCCCADEARGRRGAAPRAV